MTVPNPGALPAPAMQQPPQQLPQQPSTVAQSRPQPPPRPPLTPEAAHRARLAGGVGGGVAWLGLGIAQACGALLLLGLGIPALLLGIDAWQGGDGASGADVWPAVLPWLGSPTAIVLMAGIPLGLLIALLGLWLSARMLRRPGLARPVAVTWAAFGISLVAASLVGGLGSAAFSPFAGGLPWFGSGGSGAPAPGPGGPWMDFDPGALAEWANADRLLAMLWPFVVLGSLASLIVPIVLSVFSWWWMAHAMRPSVATAD